MGFSVLAIGERMGHEAEKITYRYAHLFPTVQTEMAEKLEMERMTEKKKSTAPVSSVGADGEQPQIKNHTEIIANETAKNNLQATVFRGFDTNCPEKSGQGGGLQTVSMTELYDTVYPPRTPVVDSFL